MGTVFQDYDNDGRPDIIVTVLPRQLYSVFHNDGGGVFTYESLETGLGSLTPGSSGWVVGLEDFDNDGYPDLFVASYGKNILYHNNGDGTFTDVTAKAGVAGGGWSGSAGFFDYNNDGHLDLFVTRYMEWDADHNKICGGSWKTYCPPGEFPGTTCLLYRNRGDGTFEDVSERSGIAAEKGRALGVAFAD